jgi:hypothetical protein
LGNRTDVRLVIKQEKYRVFDFEMVTLGKQGEPLGTWGLRLKVIHIPDLDKTVTQGKAAETLD